jgi:hypothetical protein
MSEHFGTANAAALEQCVDQIDDFIETLDQYQGSVIALALRIHLGALLRAMLDDQVCSREDVRDFVVALEQEVITGQDL